MSATKRVVLFTPFSPDIGGGATNLRTLVPRLGIDVEWLYTASGPAHFPGTTCIGPPMAGGNAWHDLSRQIALWGGLPTASFARVMSRLTRDGSTSYWVVGHNEGVAIARSLARRGARVHLTIQDDVPDGMFARSRRYRPLAPLVRLTYADTLRRMASIDVTSDGMQRYYRENLGLQTQVVHPFVPGLPAGDPTPPPDGELRVGHVGSIYSVEEWRTFVAALRRVARERNRRPRMLMIGLAARYRPAAADLGDTVDIVDDLPEDEAVARISGCHFLYAMYPFDQRSEVFRTTSLPTKLSTYVKGLRPILAHTPGRSTLVDIVDRYGLGVVCTSTSLDDVAAVIRRACDAPSVPRHSYEAAREEIYGIGNVDRLRACLEAL